MDKPQQKGPPINIVKSNIALKLAEQWVNNMTAAEDDEQTEVVGRPSRLGLGAKVPRQTKIGPLNDPLERKLYATLTGARNRNVGDESSLAASKKDDCGNDGDSDDSEDLESRTQVFDRKRTANPITLPAQTKKRK